jgi:hypothetical protein
MAITNILPAAVNALLAIQSAKPVKLNMTAIHVLMDTI